MAPIEDMIYQRWDEDRARATAFSFAPLYQFLSAVAHVARMDERQAIVDLVRAARQQGRGRTWNAGYDAALTAITRAAVERAHQFSSLSSPLRITLPLPPVPRLQSTPPPPD